MIALLTGATGVAAGTWLAGWAAVPVSGAVVGAWLGWAARQDAALGFGASQPWNGAYLLGRRWAPAAAAALAGVLGWGVLLLLAAARGPATEVARLAGGVLGGLPGPAFFAVVLLFAGALAGAAGGASHALVQLAARAAPAK